VVFNSVAPACGFEKGCRRAALASMCVGTAPRSVGHADGYRTCTWFCHVRCGPVTPSARGAVTAVFMLQRALVTRSSQ